MHEPGRRRVRTRARENQRATTLVDANLLDASARLGDAVAALTARQARPIAGAGSGWLPSRYVMLRGALYGTRGGGGRNSQPSSVIPCWVDALKLLITINDRAAELERWHRGRCAGRPVCCYLAAHRCDHATVRRVCALPDYPCVAPAGPMSGMFGDPCGGEAQRLRDALSQSGSDGFLEIAAH